MSDDWRHISKIMETVKTTFACFDTNRLIAVENEVELEKLATKLFENATFLVGKSLIKNSLKKNKISKDLFTLGFVFENVDPANSELPSNFSVKLRMNVNNVPETNLIRPW